MHRALTGLLIALLFAGAARAEAPDFKATAHKVAIVSLLGDELNLGEVAGQAVPNAGFDALAEEAMRKQIAADLPGAAVTVVDAPRGDLLAQLYPAGSDGDAGLDNLRQALRNWAAEHGVDYIVVLRKASGQPFPAAPDFSFFGIGLAPKNGKGAPVPAAILNVVVLDGTSLTQVADLSVRDTDWSQFNFKKSAPQANWLARLVDDTKAMLASMAPALVKGVGL